MLLDFKRTEVKIVVSLILVLMIVLCVFPIAKKTSSVETHQARIEAIDGKIENVLKLTAGATVASAGITAIPGDTATPIAEKLADFSEYFLIILCVLYSEKYLLTILGLGVFRIIIPVALTFFVAAIWFKPDVLKKVAIKLSIFGLALYLAVPLSLKVSDMIFETYQDAVANTIENAQTLGDEAAVIAENTEDEGMLSSVLKQLSETASGITEKAANLLKRYVETLAVLIVTSCVIPLLVVILIIWLAKILIGINSLPVIALLPEENKKRHEKQNI